MRYLKLPICFLLILIFIFSFCIPCFAEETTYVWSSSSNTLDANVVNTTTHNSTSTSQTTTSTNPIASNSTSSNTTTVPKAENTSSTNAENNSNSLNLESGSAILIEQSTGQVLYSHNIHEQLRPASVTKVMSILLIMEALDSRKN